MKLTILFESLYVERENRSLLGYYATRSGNLIRIFRNYLSVTFSGFKNPKKTPEDGTDWLSRNVGKKLPLLAA